MTYLHVGSVRALCAQVAVAATFVVTAATGSAAPAAAASSLLPISSASPAVEPVAAQSSADLNFVVIVIDDVGAEWFDWSGLAEPNSGFVKHPRLSSLRQQGVAFRRAYATPICAPTRARIWSSQYGFDSALGGNPSDVEDFAFGGGGAPIADWQHPAPITTKLLPRLLAIGRDGTDSLPPASATYAQACFGKTHMHGAIGRETWPCDHGVHRYVGCQPNAGELPQGDPNTGHYHFVEITQDAGSAPTSRTWGAAGTWPAGGPYVAYDTSTTPPSGWDAYTVLRNSITWINAQTKPFLAIVNFNPPHAPFEVPPFTAPDDVGAGATGGTFQLVSNQTKNQLIGLDGGSKGPGYEPISVASTRAVFKANFEAIDALIGKLWDRIEPTRRAKTVFFVVGDNGTVANVVDAPYQASHSKRTPYEQGVQVPWIVWGPPSVIGSPGRTSSHLVHVVDLMPTVLDLAQCDVADWSEDGARTVRGRSFRGVLASSQAEPARDHVYNETFLPLDATIDGPVPIDPSTWMRTYSDGTYKLISRPGNEWELYRIDATIRPESGEPGYFERAVDDLYPSVGKPGADALTETFAALRDAMLSLIQSE